MAEHIHIHTHTCIREEMPYTLPPSPPPPSFLLSFLSTLLSALFSRLSERLEGEDRCEKERKRCCTLTYWLATPHTLLPPRASASSCVYVWARGEIAASWFSSARCVVSRLFFFSFFFRICMRGLEREKERKCAIGVMDNTGRDESWVPNFGRWKCGEWIFFFLFFSFLKKFELLINDK